MFQQNEVQLKTKQNKIKKKQRKNNNRKRCKTIVLRREESFLGTFQTKFLKVWLQVVKVVVRKRLLTAA